MMVVQEDDERLVEVAVIRKPLLEQKSYVIVKNHVRELPNTVQNKTIMNNRERKPLNLDIDGSRKRNQKFNIKYPKIVKIPISPESDYSTQSTSEIDPEDLEDLRNVYTKCKEVMERIETKYGHLLDTDSEAPNQNSLKRKIVTPDKCTCKANKKIVFDDDGKQSTIDMISEKHICVQNMMDVPPKLSKTRNKNISVEYEGNEIVLPATLRELGAMLVDPDMKTIHRNQVIDKMQTLRYEYANDIRFNKHILIEQLKSNPDEVLDFKGTNLSTLPGYS